MTTNTITTKLPTKVADFARFLDNNNIAYTLTSEVSDCLEHSTFWTFSSVEGRWFEASVHALFLVNEKHTTNYGKTKRSSQRFCSAWAIGMTADHKAKTVRDAQIMWTVYASRIDHQTPSPIKRKKPTMRTNTTATDFTTYKNVIINNVRNAGTDSIKIMQRDIEVTYLADRWGAGGDAVVTTTSLPRAKAMIDWLLDNGATVEANRIVTTLGQIVVCMFGDPTTGVIGYSKFLK